MQWMQKGVGSTDCIWLDAGTGYVFDTTSSCHVVRLSPSQTAVKPGGKMGCRGASLNLNEAATFA